MIYLSIFMGDFHNIFLDFLPQRYRPNITITNLGIIYNFG